MSTEEMFSGIFMLVSLVVLVLIYDEPWCTPLLLLVWVCVCLRACLPACVCQWVCVRVCLMFIERCHSVVFYSLLRGKPCYDNAHGHLLAYFPLSSCQPIRTRNRRRGEEVFHPSNNLER